MSTVHVVPVDDVIDHDSSGGDCPCEPTTEPVMRDDGSNGWLVKHARIGCPRCYHSVKRHEERGCDMQTGDWSTGPADCSCEWSPEADLASSVSDDSAPYHPKTDAPRSSE